jgi:hypothetical protein
MMSMFAQALDKAGANPSVDSLANSLETISFSRDMFGSPEYKFSKTNHLGNDKSRIGQIQNGKWIAVSDYLNY